MLMLSMGLTNDSLIDTVFEKHPEKKEIPEQGDEIFVNWNFQDFQVCSINFIKCLLILIIIL